jgi:hypothetical protein
MYKREVRRGSGYFGGVEQKGHLGWDGFSMRETLCLLVCTRARAQDPIAVPAVCGRSVMKRR